MFSLWLDEILSLLRKLVQSVVFSEVKQVSGLSPERNFLSHKPNESQLQWDNPQLNLDYILKSPNPLESV